MPRAAKANRTDLNGPKPAPGPPVAPPLAQNAKPQAVTTATGLQYGEAQKLAQAQKAQPLPGPANSAQAALSAASQMQPPEHLDLSRPTDRPTEPITAGMPSGPGPGPESMAPIPGAPPQIDPLITGAAALNALGAQADPDTQRLRTTVNALIANRATP